MALITSIVEYADLPQNQRETYARTVGARDVIYILIADESGNVLGCIPSHVLDSLGKMQDRSYMGDRPGSEFNGFTLLGLTESMIKVAYNNGYRKGISDSQIRNQKPVTKPGITVSTGESMEYWNGTSSPVQLFPLTTKANEDMTSYGPPLGDYYVILNQIGESQKINAIKVIRSYTRLGLREAKELADHVPSKVIEHVTQEYAMKMGQAFASVDCSSSVIHHSR